MKKYLLLIFFIVLILIILFFATSERIAFSDLMQEEFHDEEMYQIIIEKRESGTEKQSFLIVDSPDKINQLIRQFSNVQLNKYRLGKNDIIQNEYAISFQQPSEMHNLYTNHHKAQFKRHSFKLKENNFIEIINSFSTSDDWLNLDEYLEYYQKD